MQKSKGSSALLSWHSSYEENNYGDFFYSLIRIYKPKKVVELGTKDGYSAYHIARALKENTSGTLDCYDLWEKYTENYGFGFTPQKEAEKNLEQFKDIVKLNLENSIGVEKKYSSVDILHVDLDNDGDILEKVVPLWIDKVRDLIIIEGGSIERDQLDFNTNTKKMPVTEWFESIDTKKTIDLKKAFPKQTGLSQQFVVVEGNKYRKKTISGWLKNFAQKRNDIEYFTITPFPSVTLIKRRIQQTPENKTEF